MRNDWMKWAAAGLAAGLALAAGGCIGPTSYHSGDLFGGYGDSSEGAGVYEVHFIAQKRSFDFAKACAYYRAAEVAYLNNYRYFSVTKIDDYSSAGYSPNSGQPGAGTVSEIPQVSLHIQCYTQRPPVACYDAYQYLNMVKVPGTDAVYSVQQRQADKAAGKTGP